MGQKMISSLLIIIPGTQEEEKEAEPKIAAAIYKFLRSANDDLYRASNGHFRRHPSRLYHSIKCKISPFPRTTFFYASIVAIYAAQFVSFSFYISRHEK